jgi:hypothetical protein
VSLIAEIPDSANHPRVESNKITGRTARDFHHDILYFFAQAVDGVAGSLWCAAGAHHGRTCRAGASIAQVSGSPQFW